MTFADGIANLRDGQAIKRPSWGGYVKKIVTKAEGETPEEYKLVFVKRGSEVTYEYKFVGTQSCTEPETKVEIDDELMLAMMADDWIRGSAADFEAARSGTGRDW